MKNINYKKILLLMLLFILLLIYSMIIVELSCDEIWEYGYGYNIATGLIPYRDFNMVATPLFPFCIAIFIKIFGPYLLSAHIFNIIIFISIIAMMYKIIGNKTLIIVPLLLCSEYSILPTYNSLITFFAILLIYIKKTSIKEKNKVLLSGLIISLMVLTKQSIGITFFILELIMTKEKKQYLLTFSIPMIMFLTYLIINKALNSFIDYSILGLFEFGKKNSYFSNLLIVYIIMVLILIVIYIKYKNKNTLYGLAFMTMCIPICNIVHIFSCFSYFFLTIFQNIKYPNYLNKYFLIYSFLIVLLFSIFSIEICLEKQYLYLRNIGKMEYLYIVKETSLDLDRLKKKYDKTFYFCDVMAYTIKLYRNEKIDKYDMILNGNMGYDGEEKYIKEIDNYCKNNKCLFLILPYINEGNQINRQIINYVKENYNYIDRNDYLLFYSN